VHRHWTQDKVGDIGDNVMMMMMPIPVTTMTTVHSQAHLHFSLTTFTKQHIWLAKAELAQQHATLS
jgi:hypothetical protein